MAKQRNKELIRQLGMNALKPDSFQKSNEPLMRHLSLWSNENIDLHDVIQQFFGLKVRTKIVGFLLDLDLNNWVGIAASWQHNNQNGQIRIDSNLTQYFLERAFGESSINRPFSIKKVTQLELGVLQSFLMNLEVKMKEFWEIDSKHPYLLDMIYLVWLVESDEGQIGRIAFGMPASFKPKRVPATQGNDVIDINKLANTGIKVPIKMYVGKTNLTLKDIRSLEKDDLVVFEDSDIERFYWHLGEIGLVLPEDDHPVFIRDIDNIEDLAEDMMKPIHNDEDMLSSLPLELSAEFQKVLIPLKQVLDLKAGGVLPLGSVLDSELILTAQGKPVAKGDLVIVGNQFGMRITDILIGSKKHGSVAAGGVELEELFTKPQSARNVEPATFADQLEDLEEDQEEI
jgi:flagellar motor switch/type III secretory pathway protein FliN